MQPTGFDTLGISEIRQCLTAPEYLPLFLRGIVVLSNLLIFQSIYLQNIDKVIAHGDMIDNFINLSQYTFLPKV